MLNDTQNKTCGDCPTLQLPALSSASLNEPPGDLVLTDGDQ